jgi:putative thioredoxin
MSYDIHDFNADVIERSYKIPVLVDFWAEWCGPCRVLGPVLERLAEQAKDRWVLAKLNTELHPDIAMQYGVQGIPNVKLFVDGEIVDEFVGAMPEEMIVQWLRKVLPSRYREQIKQAQQLLAEHQIRKAQTLLEGIMKAEPKNHQATALLAQSYVYSDHQKALELVSDIGADSEYFDFAEAIRTLGRLFQASEQPEKLPESSVKEQYLAAIARLQAEHFDEALEQFIEVIRLSRSYDEDGARKACIAIFKFLGEEHEITKQYRKEFSSALYV